MRMRTSITMTFLAGVLAVVGSGCKKKNNAGGGSGGGGTVTLAGSNSMQPFAEQWAEEFKGGHVNVQAGGSTAGIKAAHDGTANIGMSSRELKPDEKAGLVEFIIAYDGIAVIVHKNNPVADLTIDKVRDIYSGKIKNWKDVGGPDKGITVITREDGSGTRGAFEELVMGKGVTIDTGAIVQAQTGGLRKMVAGDESAIGYMTMGQVTDEVKALKLNGIDATEPNVANNTYPVKRPFVFMTKGEPTGATKAFIDFVMSDAGQKIAKEAGLVPVK